MSLRYFVFVVFCSVIIHLSASAQQVRVGQWRDHIPYLHATKVITGSNKVYCITTSGMFSYNKSDNSTEKMSKITGLSDVGVSSAGFSKEYNKLVIGYSNGNLDILDGTTIYNLSDIKNKEMSGSKIVNNILFIGNLAYLSCGFGIVVLDILRMEIKDTYLIGPNGDYLDVRELAYDGTYLYAATEKGVYKGRQNNPNLVNFAEWVCLSDVQTGQPNAWVKNKTFSSIAIHNNKIYTVCIVGTNGKDSLMTYSDSQWQVFRSGGKYNCVRESSGFLIIAQSWGSVDAYDVNMIKVYNVWTYNGWAGLDPNWAEFDNDQKLWIADNFSGLVYMHDLWSGEKMYPQGPEKSSVASMSVADDKLWTAVGAKNSSWGNMWQSCELNSFILEQWRTFNVNNTTPFTKSHDIIKVIVNPENSDQVFAASWNGGIFEFRNGEYYKVYNETNSTLRNILADTAYRTVKIAGMTFDQNNNLWVTNSSVAAPFSVRTSNGSWYSFPYGPTVNAATIGDIIVTKNNHKWAILPRGAGFFAFDENGTYDNTSDDKLKKFGIQDENGKPITNDIFSIAEDLNGVIWVGTNKGVVAYYNPENIFTSTNFYAQQIKVPNEVPGQANYLLETEIVNAIAIDGSNKKWFGTESAGVYLMSEDCVTEIYHFTSENSPLLSNNVTCITINGVTGEVFFGTDKGIISFRGTATDGADEFKDVLVFPNPVKPEYNGLITIRGLVTNSNVKITDITGSIVFETKAEGGQAIWNGKDFNGDKVHTGVYMIFSTNEDGSQTNVSKVLFVN